MPGRESLEAAFRAIRTELGIRRGFPPEVLREAERSALRGEEDWGGGRRDLRELPFVTIDPPGSRDLDQALFIEEREGGYRVRYAIADVGAFVERGSAVEVEAWKRGLTFYSPDQREPLYPPVLSQGAASLLPASDRPAVVFSIELDGRGALVEMRVERGVVRSRAQLTYAQALRQVEYGGSPSDPELAPSLSLLRVVGELRRQRERERGGVSLPIRDQHVQQRSALSLGYELVYEEPNAVEEWNAQVSLLTGHAAALRMLRTGRGLLRTTAPPRAEEVERFRVAARTLGFEWPEGGSYAEFIHGLDLSHPHVEPLIWQARRLMRGADYVPFDGEPPARVLHSALAMPYSHCTAPLRRLPDRYVLELLAPEEESRPAAGGMAPLMELPSVMDQAERTAHRLERRVVDVAEAWVLRARVGETFPAVVLDVRPDRVEAQIPDPPIRARVALRGGTRPLALGERVRVRLQRVEPAEGTVEFALE